MSKSFAATHTAHQQCSNCKCVHVLLTPVFRLTMSTNHQSDLNSSNRKSYMISDNFKSNFQPDKCTNQTADVQSNSQFDECTNQTAGVKSNIQSNSQSTKCTSPTASVQRQCPSNSQSEECTNPI